MNRSFFIKPAKPGLIVRDPVSGSPLPADGAEKPRCQYWLRRQLDGDVVVCDPPKPPAKKSAPAQAATAAEGGK